MTYAGVSRLVVAMAAALAAAAVGFAIVTTEPAPFDPAEAVERTAGASLGAADEALFAARCGECHERQGLVDYLRAGPDIDLRRRQMEVFLAAHGPASGDEIPRLAGYLATLAAR